MRRTNTLIVIALALLAMATASCDKGRLGRDTGLNAGKGVGMMFRTPSSTSFFETKAAAAPVLNKVYGSEDDGFVIEEYVSDIEDVMRTPETKGTEIKQKTASSGNFNVANRQFQVMAFLDTTKTVSGVEETCPINEFNYPAKYDGSKWNWVLPAGKKDPCWRTSTKYSIWSYWPIDDDVTLGSRSAVSEPDGGNWATSGTYNTVSFTHTVPKALEAQQDLLFAYNEETRDFAHIDGDDKKNYVYAGKEQAWIDNAGNDGQIFDDKNGNPKSRGINIHFYHALAAVKFELNSKIYGKTPYEDVDVDVHSITLCCTDNTTSHNIIADDGIATTGSCTATGTATSSGGKVTFAWTNQGTKKPLHYEFDSSHSVAGNYTTTGSGVLFMIPQTVQNIKIIVEFSKNGGTHYYTKIMDLGNVTWAAGKYYTYRLSIGEFHVLGEKMTELTNILIQGLDASKTLLIRPEGDPVPSKGVTKMALITKGYGLEVSAKQVVSMHSNAYGGDNDVPSQADSIAFDLLPYTLDASDNLTSFGGDGITEKYGKRADFSNTKNKNNKNPAIDSSTAAAYVFETGGKDTFFLYFRPQSNNNSGGFAVELRGLYVVEVAEDSNLPGNFNTIDWSTI